MELHFLKLYSIDTGNRMSILEVVVVQHAYLGGKNSMIKL
jgi:hypothetical protein